MLGQAEEMHDEKSSEIPSEVFVNIAQNQRQYIDRLAKDESLANETARAIYDQLPNFEKLEM